MTETMIPQTEAPMLVNWEYKDCSIYPTLRGELPLSPTVSRVESIEVWSISGGDGHPAEVSGRNTVTGEVQRFRLCPVSAKETQ